MSEIIGHVDSRDRALVSLVVPNQDDGLLIVVDSGFNRQLLIHESDSARLRCALTDSFINVELAGRVRRSFRVGRSEINWFGRPTQVEVLITAAEQSRAALPDEPIGLLGTGLLSPHKLMIDFATRRVVIAEHEG